MAGADASIAPEGSTFARQGDSRESVVTGNARIIAAPAYLRLLAAEPWLKRSIPILILIFLVVVASVRLLSLMALRDDVDRDARAILNLAAGEISNALMLPDAADGTPELHARDLLRGTRLLGSLGREHVLVITDGDFKVVAATAQARSWEGNNLDRIVAGGQPLFLFGDRAGAMEVSINGEKWFAAAGLTDQRNAAAMVMIPQEAVFAEWRRTVSMNVTLFVLTAGVLLIILYAYFSQAARAQAADRIYLEAHQRIDLALVRGRCGLWDWDMVRGKMYWSRSMYDMLGYRPCDAMLSFGEVAEIIHDDDGDLFKLANRDRVARDRPYRPGLPHAPRQRAVGLDARPGAGDRSRGAGNPADRHRRRRYRAAPSGAALRDRRHAAAHGDREHQRILRALGFAAAAGDVQHQVPAV